MNARAFNRQAHRWLATLFTLAVVANFVYRAMAHGEPPAWITYAPLPPLFLQWFTGLILFVLPHAGRTRGRARA